MRINDKELEGNKSSRFCVISSKTVSLTSNRDWVWHSLGKKKKNIWKGEGIYFITFAVTGRQKLLGNLVRIMEDGSYASVRPTDKLEQKQLEGRWNFEKYGEHTATVRKNALGFMIANDLQHIQ